MARRCSPDRSLSTDNRSTVSFGYLAIANSFFSRVSPGSRYLEKRESKRFSFRWLFFRGDVPVAGAVTTSGKGRRDEAGIGHENSTVRACEPRDQQKGQRTPFVKRSEEDGRRWFAR